MKIKVIIKQSDGIDQPHFGAYLSGTASKGCTEISLNIELVKIVQEQEGLSVEEVKEMMCGVVAHEILHALQELCGLPFDEESIDTALGR